MLQMRDIKGHAVMSVQFQRLNSVIPDARESEVKASQECSDSKVSEGQS